MLKIRLSRIGKKKQPFYRVVVADARKPRDGAYVEIIGHYNPRTEPTTFDIDADKVRDWLAKGAQPTLIVDKLLARQGLRPARVWPEPKPKVSKDAKAASPAAAAAPAAVAPTAIAEEAPTAAAEEAPAAIAEEAPAAVAEEAPAAEATEEAPAEETT
ncbi:MAG TPA: 30S ribosomal protein S16 [Dehalococcoidia bacterium]|nr:30S ribosomal protein S16 [Dehalococcoidia bacterium]